MKKEIQDFIRKNNLTPFGPSSIEKQDKKIFRTKDAKGVSTKVLSRIASCFTFSSTRHILDLLSPCELQEIRKRQEFFKGITPVKKEFLKSLVAPRAFWRPGFSAIAATEDPKTFSELKRLQIPAAFIQSQTDAEALENYDVVEAIDCDQFSGVLEQLESCLFVDDIKNIFLEMHLMLLSGWKGNLEILEQNMTSLEALEPEIPSLIKELNANLAFLEISRKQKVTRESAEAVLKEINDNVSLRIKEVTVTGESLVDILMRDTLPKEFMDIVKENVDKSNLPGRIFNLGIPVKMDYEELDRLIKENDSAQFTSFVSSLQKKAGSITRIPEDISRLSDLLLTYDFKSGIAEFISSIQAKYPSESDSLDIRSSKNLFLDDPQPISFLLDGKSTCSILTGANSGGKTTLLEHILQLVCLFQMGLPCSGQVDMPLFSEVYYFAKNKGSMSKGAFETLLTEMSRIRVGKKTLILADEIEAVTEPGVASAIICATASYFISKGCMMVIATHLGQDIINKLPKQARIDGIEAKGLDKDNNLIVDHNPVLGRLAHSTPELIVERLAKTKNEEYFNYLYSTIKH